MKPSFHARLINGPFDDPGLYVRVLREGRALMFDLGATTNLSARDILKTTDIFVSHTHLDHFIGFDNILRVCLRREDALRLYGPEGFIECVEGKLRGYTWNLTRDYPLAIEVMEIRDHIIKKACFKAENSFMREDLPTGHFCGLLMKNSFYSVSATVLDHQIRCLAFSLKEDRHINIDKAELGRLNLPVGPWLRELKQAIREDAQEKVFTINGKSYDLSSLRKVAKITRGQKLSYVVDAAGSEGNVKKIIDLARGSDVLYIETYFSDAERERAKDRYHLTAREAGKIGRQAGAGRLEVMHFSPRYFDEPGRLAQEAQEEFNRQSAMP